MKYIIQLHTYIDLQVASSGMTWNINRPVPTSKSYVINGVKLYMQREGSSCPIHIKITNLRLDNLEFPDKNQLNDARNKDGT